MWIEINRTEGLKPHCGIIQVTCGFKTNANMLLMMSYITTMPCLYENKAFGKGPNVFKPYICLPVLKVDEQAKLRVRFDKVFFQQ